MVVYILFFFKLFIIIIIMMMMMMMNRTDFWALYMSGQKLEALVSLLNIPSGIKGADLYPFPSPLSFTGGLLFTKSVFVPL